MRRRTSAYLPARLWWTAVVWFSSSIIGQRSKAIEWKSADRGRRQRRELLADPTPSLRSATACGGDLRTCTAAHESAAIPLERPRSSLDPVVHRGVRSYVGHGMTPPLLQTME